MAEVTKQTVTETTNPTAKQPVAVADEPKREHRITIAERIIYLVGGVLLAFLGMRILLMLLGANSGAGFADFVYDVSRPFAAPFFNLFSYDEQFGASRFEYGTLIAMLVYAGVMILLARVVSLPSRRER